MDIARTAHRCVVARAVALADYAPVYVRSGPGWLAVRTGAESNDLNVVVSEAGFLPPTTFVEELVRWFARVPASWLIEEPDEALTEVLCGAGWTPERTGRWCGRAVVPIRPALDGVEITALGVDRGLDDWHDVALSCGWFADLADREVRRVWMPAMMADRRRGAWVARFEDRPVGMATGWCDDGVVELVDVAVRVEARRHGVGTALVARVMSWGSHRGAREVVAAPSPNGWRLLGSLGFDNVEVVPETCFYLSEVP